MGPQLLISQSVVGLFFSVCSHVSLIQGLYSSIHSSGSVPWNRVHCMDDSFMDCVFPCLVGDTKLSLGLVVCAGVANSFSNFSEKVVHAAYGLWGGTLPSGGCCICPSSRDSLVCPSHRSSNSAIFYFSSSNVVSADAAIFAAGKKTF